MKTVYVNTSTFDVSMTEKEGYLPFKTDLFNNFSDKDIEAQFYVPEGYKYEDPESGDTYTGEYVCTKSRMVTAQSLAQVRDAANRSVKLMDIVQNEVGQALFTMQHYTNDVEDIMLALVELGDLVASLSSNES